MYWFVIYATRAHSRARAEALAIGPPRSATWRELESSTPGEEGPPQRRFSAMLEDSEWAELCAEFSLDIDRACREPRRASVCEAVPLPVTMLSSREAELPGMSAIIADFQEAVVGPVAAIALDLSAAPEARGSAAHLEVGLCVAPLPETEAESQRSRALFEAAAFNLGGTETELRCPDCASPELRWRGGPDLERQMGCDNCGAELARGSAFVSLAECEAILAAVPAPPLARTCAQVGSP